MFDLSGKKVLLTGASGGIGQQVAQSFAAQGAKLVLSGTRREKLEEVAGLLPGEPQIVVSKLDTAEGPQALVQEAEKLVEGLDILVANAGITRDNLLMRMSDEEWDTVFQVNLRAIFQMTRAVIKGMMKRRWGRVILMSSVVGKTGNAGQTNYAAAKAALEGFGKSLAQEVASRGITVNCIAPGFIETPMTENLPEAQRTKLLSVIPKGAMGRPEDIAAGCVYLASDEASYVTGQTLHINGGMAML